MALEITEEEDVEPPCIINSEHQKNSIRRIIDYQKSLYYSSSSISSSSFASAAASSSSFSSSRKNNTLIDLMKAGNTSLRRLFDMEHTSLATYLRDYSSSPLMKPIPLWGSDTDDDNHDDPWMSFKNYGAIVDPGNDSQNALASQSSFSDGISIRPDEKIRIRKQKLSRKQSFRRLPRFSVWRCGGFRFRFRLRLKRLRIIFRGRKF